MNHDLWRYQKIIREIACKTPDPDETVKRLKVMYPLTKKGIPSYLSNKVPTRIEDNVLEIANRFKFTYDFLEANQILYAKSIGKLESKHVSMIPDNRSLFWLLHQIELIVYEEGIKKEWDEIIHEHPYSPLTQVRKICEIAHNSSFLTKSMFDARTQNQTRNIIIAFDPVQYSIEMS